MKNSELEEKRLKRMIVRILEVEKDNIVKKNKKRDEMVEEIRKIIENEVKRCY